MRETQIRETMKMPCTTYNNAKIKSQKKGLNKEKSNPPSVFNKNSTLKGCPISKRSRKKTPNDTCALETRKRDDSEVKAVSFFCKFSTVVHHGRDLGPRPRRFSPSGFFFTGDVSLRTSPPPSPLEWLPFPPPVAAVLITPKDAHWQ